LPRRAGCFRETTCLGGRVASGERLGLGGWVASGKRLCLGGRIASGKRLCLGGRVASGKRLCLGGRVASGKRLCLGGRVAPFLTEPLSLRGAEAFLRVRFNLPAATLPGSEFLFLTDWGAVGRDRGRICARVLTGVWLARGREKPRRDSGRQRTTATKLKKPTNHEENDLKKTKKPGAFRHRQLSLVDEPGPARNSAPPRL